MSIWYLPVSRCGAAMAQGVCANAQPCQSLSCSNIKSIDVDEDSN